MGHKLLSDLIENDIVSIDEEDGELSIEHLPTGKKSYPNTIKGAMLTKSDGQLVNSGAFDTVTWENSDEYGPESDGFVNLTGDAFVVPAGVDRIKLTVQIHWNAAVDDPKVLIRKNGSSTYNGVAFIEYETASVRYLQAETAWIDVAENDEFTVDVEQNDGTERRVEADRSWFELVAR